MAALTTPIVRGNMRLYPGMPVHRKGQPGARKRAGTLPKGANALPPTPAHLHNTPGGMNPRIKAQQQQQLQDNASLTACSAFDVTFDANGNNSSPMARPAKPTPLSVSQQYLNARRRIAHKPMTEEQQRRRTRSLYANMQDLAEAGKGGDGEENGNGAPGASSGGRKGIRKKSSSIRRFFQKFRISTPSPSEPVINNDSCSSSGAPDRPNSPPDGATLDGVDSGTPSEATASTPSLAEVPSADEDRNDNEGLAEQSK